MGVYFSGNLLKAFSLRNGHSKEFSVWWHFSSEKSNVTKSGANLKFTISFAFLMNEYHRYTIAMKSCIYLIMIRKTCITNKKSR